MNKPETEGSGGTGRLPEHVAIAALGRQAPEGDWRVGPEATPEADRSTLREVVESALALGISQVTVVTPATGTELTSELGWLLNETQKAFGADFDELKELSVEVSIPLETGPSDPTLSRQVTRLEEAGTAGGNLLLTLRPAHSGRAALARVARRLAEQVARGDLTVEAIDESLVSSQLRYARERDPDLLISTAGANRLADCLLWELAYTEIHVARASWEEFTRSDFERAVRSYQHRERRFGRVQT